MTDQSAAQPASPTPKARAAQPRLIVGMVSICGRAAQCVLYFAVSFALMAAVLLLAHV